MGRGNLLLKSYRNFLGEASVYVTAQQWEILMSYSTAVYYFTGILFVKSFFCLSINLRYINNHCGERHRVHSNLAFTEVSRAGIPTAVKELQCLLSSCDAQL